MNIDNLFNDNTDRKSFTFNKEVAQVFNDMAHRSIPGYAVQQYTIAEYVLRYFMPDSIILDLGCGVGKTIETITRALTQCHDKVLKGRVIASDGSHDMVEECKIQLSFLINKWQSIDVIWLDLTDIDSTKRMITKYNEPVSVIILHFILQFLPLDIRYQILRICWDRLSVGGILMIGEKLQNSDEHTQKIWEKMQYRYKRMQGYSDIQIYTKQQALEGILIQDYVDNLEDVLASLPKSKTHLYYAHGEFRCYAIRKQ